MGSHGCSTPAVRMESIVKQGLISLLLSQQEAEA